MCQSYENDACAGYASALRTNRECYSLLGNLEWHIERSWFWFIIIFRSKFAIYNCVEFVPIPVDECRNERACLELRRVFALLFYCVHFVWLQIGRTVQSTHKIRWIGTFIARRRRRRAHPPRATLPKLFVVMLWSNFLRILFFLCYTASACRCCCSPSMIHWRTISAEPIKILRIISRVNSSPSEKLTWFDSYILYACTRARFLLPSDGNSGIQR